MSKLNDLQRKHGYPNQPSNMTPHCEGADLVVEIDTDYGGQTEGCLTCGRIWSCEYGGANPQDNGVKCTKIN